MPALHAAESDEPVDIGSRREFFVDDLMIASMQGARQVLHEPQPAGVALQFDRPWEGRYCGYVTVLHDGDRFRMYYRGLPTVDDVRSHQVVCYAESPDGIHWERPSLGFHEVHGTRDNNVVLAGEGDYCHNFSPFLDERPGVPAAERYKALSGLAGGLVAFVSADGLRWRRLHEAPVLTQGAFDSQNVAFWSAAEDCYVCYLRTYRDRIRGVSRATSPDFLHWSAPVEMQTGPGPVEQLYTNQTHPYFRGPHLYISLAARFMEGRRVLTDDQARALGVEEGYRGDCSDVVLLTSRGGTRFDRRFREAFIRPGLGAGNWVSRANYAALGVVPTGPAEMSLFVQRDYGQPTHRLERLTLRLDGFASVRAPWDGGELITRSLRFEGSELVLNYSTSAAGGIHVEIQEPSGKPIPGFALADAVELVGDEITRAVAWRNEKNVSELAGRAVRLRFVMTDADLYSFQFRPTPAAESK
ncbi:MAG: hypothetical protein JXB13_17980 [Phycisphaerae bacterium]|nr:hypothetical protein [Phycisphaerae bacterium]